MSGFALTVTIPGRIKSVGQNRGTRWGKGDYNRKWRFAAGVIVKEQMRLKGWLGIDPALPKAIVFKSYTRNFLDDDNLRPAFKPIRDALKDAGVINDDRPSAGHTFDYQQEIDRKSPLRVAIRIALR